MTAQQPPIIAAKLNVPAPRPNFISRPALNERLAELCSHKATVIKGAAGSGKSTLLAAYASEHPDLSIRWVSLDAADNNVRTLWTYVLEALSPDLGPRAEAWRDLLGVTLQAGDITTVLVELVNGWHPDGDVFLVLDDAHYLTDPRVLESLQFLLRYSSDRVHLVLLTRDEPKLYLGELRMAGQLLEIDNDDLKVTEAEARQFLTQTLRLGLGEVVLQRIIELAEGWIGGLQLLGVAWGDRENRVASVASLGRPVVEYLSGELLGSLAEAEQRFLVSTSILTYLDADVCRAVTETGTAADVLQRLLDKHLFIITVDAAKGLYRYHQLFKEFLQQQFAKWPEHDRRKAHRRAAEFYRSRAHMETSVHHYLQADDYDEALALIGRMQSGASGWPLLQQVPLPALAGKPDFVYQRMFSHLVEQQFEQVLHIYDHFRGTFEDALANELFDLFPTLIDHSPLPVRPDEWSYDTLAKLGLGDETQVVLYSLLSVVLTFQEDEQEALACLAAAEYIAKEVENPYIRYYALQFKGQIKEHMGDLLECEAVFNDMFRLTEEHPFLAPTLVTAYISITGVLLKTGRLAEARRYLDKVQPHALHSTAVEVAYLYNELEYFLLDGDKKEAARAAEDLVSLNVLESSLYRSPMLRYLLLLDRADGASLARFRFNEIAVPHWQDYLLQAQLLARDGRIAEAVDMLNDRLSDLRRRQAKLPLVDTLIVKVQVLAEAADGQINDRDRLMRNALREAVHYSYKDRVMAPFVLAGPAVAATGHRLRTDTDAELQPGETTFLDTLLGWWGEAGFGTQGAPIDRDLLSQREMEVLHVLAEGATNKQIGERLYISVATVKTHIVNIYSKLGVSNRVEAVEAARRYGLIGD